jgi:hypothetical protein
MLAPAEMEALRHAFAELDFDSAGAQLQRIIAARGEKAFAST